VIYNIEYVNSIASRRSNILSMPNTEHFEAPDSSYSIVSVVGVGIDQVISGLAR
jgi:hypothetical protein